MNYANWTKIETLKSKNIIKGVNNTTKIENSGVPVGYDDENLYIMNNNGHSIVIGSTGSGKTQSITLPMLELALRANESVVIHDTKNELYNLTSNKFKENGYNVIRINFDNTTETMHWNPFELPKKLYDDNKKDKTQDLIEDIAYYLLSDNEPTNADPFWLNSTIDYFTGLTLYSLENYDEVNLDTIFSLDEEIRNDTEKVNKNIVKDSNIYIYLRGIITAPPETKGSILSVFSQKIKKYISRNGLKNMLSKSDFQLEDISKNKNIIYLVSGNSCNSENLLPLLISQIYYAKDEYSNESGTIDVILDEFFRLNKIRNFSKILTYSRSIKISFTLMLRAYNDITNIYPKEESEIIKLNFANTIYLLSQDLDTIKEISKKCGMKNDKEPLISEEELKTLSIFEAVIITIRQMPLKTKLCPYYMLNIK